MKVLQINATCGSGSTGKICVSISEILNKHGIDNSIAYSIGSTNYKDAYKFSDTYNLYLYNIFDHLYGNNGFNSIKSTRNLIQYIEAYNPDIIHIHNIHSHDVNLKIFFTYLKNRKSKIFWTFHDCWAFTGYCMYFDTVNCSLWKKQCNKCPQKSKYSWIFDKSNQLHVNKKKIFNSIDFDIITPSNWLATLVKQSFLKDKYITVINNGVNLNVFKPCKSSFRKRYGVEDKIIILGVADIWDERKGIDVFIKLSEILSNQYAIVLVGTIKKSNIKLPNNIILINRTSNQHELAEIYSASDVFVNPTREDNYPTVNMESLACGTPVITFDTGGSSEIVSYDTGYIVLKDDIDTLVKKIKFVGKKTILLSNQCTLYARRFDEVRCYENYLNLYIGSN